MLLETSAQILKNLSFKPCFVLNILKTPLTFFQITVAVLCYFGYKERNEAEEVQVDIGKSQKTYKLVGVHTPLYQLQTTEQKEEHDWFFSFAILLIILVFCIPISL